MDLVPLGCPAIVDWHAGWAATCRADQSAFEDLAAQLPHMLFMRLDMEASLSNGSLAREMVGDCTLSLYDRGIWCYNIYY